jgi:hypothetical protein
MQNVATRTWRVFSSAFDAPSRVGGGSGSVTALALSPTDSNVLAVAFSNRTVALCRWNAAPSAASPPPALITVNDHAVSLVFTPNGRVLIAVTQIGEIVVLSVSTFAVALALQCEYTVARHVVTLPARGTRLHPCVVTSPDSSRFLTCTHDNTLRIVDIATGRAVSSVDGPSGGTVVSLDWNERGDSVCAVFKRLLESDAVIAVFPLSLSGSFDAAPPLKRCVGMETTSARFRRAAASSSAADIVCHLSATQRSAELLCYDTRLHTETKFVDLSAGSLSKNLAHARWQFLSSGAANVFCCFHHVVGFIVYGAEFDGDDRREVRARVLLDSEQALPWPATLTSAIADAGTRHIVAFVDCSHSRNSCHVQFRQIVCL